MLLYKCTDEVILILLEPITLEHWQLLIIECNSLINMSSLKLCTSLSYLSASLYSRKLKFWNTMCCAIIHSHSYVHRHTVYATCSPVVAILTDIFYYTIVTHLVQRLNVINWEMPTTSSAKSWHRWKKSTRHNSKMEWESKLRYRLRLRTFVLGI